MGMIIKENLKKMMKGYPTISDKYDVEGGINVGSTAIKFGSLVMFDTNKIAGKYAVIGDAAASAVVAGICVAENVKLVTEYPGLSKDATIESGEAVTLMTRGFIAVEVSAFTGIEAGAAVKYSDAGVFGASEANTLDGAVFTGATETDGAIKLAEIRYNI